MPVRTSVPATMERRLAFGGGRGGREQERAGEKHRFPTTEGEQAHTQTTSGAGVATCNAGQLMMHGGRLVVVGRRAEQRETEPEAGGQAADEGTGERGIGRTGLPLQQLVGVLGRRKRRRHGNGLKLVDFEAG